LSRGRAGGTVAVTPRGQGALGRSLATAAYLEASGGGPPRSEARGAKSEAQQKTDNNHRGVGNAGAPGPSIFSKKVWSGFVMVGLKARWRLGAMCGGVRFFPKLMLNRARKQRPGNRIHSAPRLWLLVGKSGGPVDRDLASNPRLGHRGRPGFGGGGLGPPFHTGPPVRQRELLRRANA